MNKRAFLEELGRLTGAMPGQERQKLLDYYEEMIDDRVEEGIPEEEAVAALGDPADIAREFAPAGVRETAEAMARACMETYRADIGIGVTGTMGNADPANPEASVPGQVYFAIGMRERGSKDPAAEPAVESFYIELAPQPSRLMYKLAVAEEVCRRLVGKLT